MNSTHLTNSADCSAWEPVTQAVYNRMDNYQKARMWHFWLDMGLVSETQARENVTNLMTAETIISVFLGGRR
jgi:hypothetical protein